MTQYDRYSNLTDGEKMAIARWERECERREEKNTRMTGEWMYLAVQRKADFDQLDTIRQIKRWCRQQLAEGDMTGITPEMAKWASPRKK